MKLYLFRTITLSIIRSFSLYTQQCYMSYSLADSLLASCQHTCMTYTIAVGTVKKNLMMNRGTVPKHVEFHSKNKFEKLVHLLGFIISIQPLTDCFLEVQLRRSEFVE